MEITCEAQPEGVTDNLLEEGVTDNLLEEEGVADKRSARGAIQHTHMKTQVSDLLVSKPVKSNLG